MERKPPRISDARRKHELRCIEACQDLTCGKLIPTGKPSSKHIIDCPRRINRPTSFDEECRQIQNEANSRNARANEYMPSETYETVYRIIKQNKRAKIDPELIHHFLMKAHNRAKEKSQKARQLSLCHSDNAARLLHQLLPTSSKISVDDVTIAALVRAVCVHNLEEESIKTSTKAIVDRMFIRGKLTSKGGLSSNAFRMSESGNELFVGLFSDTKSVLPRPIKNHPQYPQMEKEALKLVLDRKEFKGLHSTSSSKKPGCKYAARKGKMGNKSCSKSTKTNLVEQPSDRIVILKPAPRKSVKQPENVNCHCSSLQSHKKSSNISDSNPTPFSFKEMKRKLKSMTGGTRKKPSKEFPSFGPKGNLDFPSRGISPGKEKFDVILEAKKHLSARFKNVNAVDTLTSDKSPKMLGRILFSPECDFQPGGPRRGGPHGSDFEQMIFRSYNSATVTENISEMPKRKGARFSPSRVDSTVTSCDFVDENRVLQTMDTKTEYSPNSSTDEKSHDANSSSTDDIIKSNAGSKIDQLQHVPISELHTSEGPTETNSYYAHHKLRLTDVTEVQKADETDSMSENEVSTSTIEDFLSTPSTICQLDIADTIKHRDEHQSPVSVLDPFFLEEPRPTLQTGQFSDGQQFKPRCLDFEQRSFDSTINDPPNSCMQEQDHLSRYVHSVLEASCLDWDQLSEIASPHEEKILDSFLFDEVEFSPVNSYFDPKLLFDRINEILIEIYEHHFRFPSRSAFLKPEIRPKPLVELVLDEIMEGADFFVLPRTERTLDQVPIDVARCGPWIDVRSDTGEIVKEITEEYVEEWMLEVLLELYASSVCS